MITHKTGQTVHAGAGARLAIRGGNLTNGANVSPAYVNANNTLSNANANNGSRLAEWYFYAVSPCTGKKVNCLAIIGISTPLESAWHTHASWRAAS